MLYRIGTLNWCEDGTLAVDGWAVTFGTARRGLGGVPGTITVLLYDGPLLCGFNVAITGLK